MTSWRGNAFRIIGPLWVPFRESTGHRGLFTVDSHHKVLVMRRIDISFLLASTIDPSLKSHNAPVPYPTIHHFVTEMCTRVHISVTKRCIVGYFSDALWDLWDGSSIKVITLTSLSSPTILCGHTHTQCVSEHPELTNSTYIASVDKKIRSENDNISKDIAVGSFLVSTSLPFEEVMVTFDDFTSNWPVVRLYCKTERPINHGELGH